jgi:ssDNA-binding Zn-finger/Zn-ribbon topoisomerase 1
MSLEPTGSPAENHVLRDRLDQVLSHHFERITGTRNGIHGLPLTLTSVACIVLLVDREEEVTQGEDPVPRYDRADLEYELAEMGLVQDDSLNELLIWLQENGYIEVDAQDRLHAGKPTISMAHLLEHAFPGMPGLNLVAYFIQTLDEVQSERKATADAFSQLDQILQRHSAGPFRKSPPAPSTDKSRSAAPSTSRSTSPRRSPSAVRPAFASPIRFKSPASKVPSVPTESTPSESKEPALIVSGGEFAPPGQENPSPEAPGNVYRSEEMPPPPLDAIPDEPADIASESRPEPSAPVDESVIVDEVLSEDSSAEIPPSEMVQDQNEMEAKREDKEAVQDEAQEEETPSVDAPLAEPAGVKKAETPEINVTTSPDRSRTESPLPSSPFEGDSETGAEDIVAERIAAFEEKLAMQCPVCRQAFVQEKTTSKGKTYYTCTDENCVFISWGRPHHVECPRCSNPFLVESLSSSGEIVLKCPRATCRHKQPLHPSADDGVLKYAQTGSGNSKPRKKRVVRRKRVRRKP